MTFRHLESPLYLCLLASAGDNSNFIVIYLNYAQSVPGFYNEEILVLHWVH